MNRRQFLVRSVVTGGGIMATNLLSKSGLAQTPALVISEKLRPSIPYGVASGDISGNRAVIWSRCDRQARMIVEYSTSESFRNLRRVHGPIAGENTDFTARVNLAGLPQGQQIFYRVLFQDLADTNIYSIPTIGHLKTAPPGDRDIFFAWSGDTAGQGWGINPLISDLIGTGARPCAPTDYRCVAKIVGISISFYLGRPNVVIYRAASSAGIPKTSFTRLSKKPPIPLTPKFR